MPGAFVRNSTRPAGSHELIAARRPTVTKALGDLAERGPVVWTGEDWLLSGGRPAELEEISSASPRSALDED